MNQAQALIEALDEKSVSVSQQMLDGYFRAILFAETDDDGDPLEDNYTARDFDKQSQRNAKADLTKFLRAMGDDIERMEDFGLDDEDIGINFWYQQVGHGTGFWDKINDQDYVDKVEAAMRRVPRRETAMVTDDGDLQIV